MDESIVVAEGNASKVSLFSIRCYKVILGLFVLSAYSLILYLNNAVPYIPGYTTHQMMVSMLHDTFTFFLFMFAIFYVLFGPLLISLLFVSNNLIKRTFLFLITTVISYVLFVYGHHDEFNGPNGFGLLMVPLFSLFFLVLLIVISVLRRGHEYKELLYKDVSTLKRRTTILVVVLVFGAALFWRLTY